MKRKRNKHGIILFVSGGFGVRFGGNVSADLKTLRFLLSLKKMGLAITGNVVNLCRLRCGPDLYETVKKRSGRGGGILLLSERDAGSETEGKGAKRGSDPVTELIVAVCAEELFFLIDEEKEELKIMSEEEERAFMDEAGSG